MCRSLLPWWLMSFFNEVESRIRKSQKRYCGFDRAFSFEGSTEVAPKKKGFKLRELKPLILLVRPAGFEPAAYGLEVR